jgi:hypothetical protein
MASEGAEAAAAAEELLAPLSSKAGQLLDKMSAVFTALDPQVRGVGCVEEGEMVRRRGLLDPRVNGGLNCGKQGALMW